MSEPVDPLPPGGAALVLEPKSPRPVAEIGRVLSYHLGLHPTDAIARVRYGGGVLLQGIDAGSAERVAAQLARVGVAARRVDGTLLGELPRGQRLRSLEVRAETVEARLYLGGERSLTRADLRGIHLYALPDPAARAGEPPPDGGRAGRLRHLRGFRALARRPLAPTAEEARALVEARWFERQHHDVGEEVSLSATGRKLRESLLALGDPPPRLYLTLFGPSEAGPLRASQEEIDYSALGGEKAVHSMDNFLRLLAALRSFAPRAWMVERIGLLLERADPSELLYFKPEEAQNLERWMQLWIRIRETEEP
jgi:hypothetical protein